MLFRILGFLILAAGFTVGQVQPSVRGKLIQPAGEQPYLDVSGHRIALEADEDTLKVLRDERLAGADVELIGTPKDPDHFTVAGTERHPVFVWKDNKRLYVSYWCDVCYIRTYVPGNCWCCQKYTLLDLREKLDDE